MTKEEQERILKNRGSMIGAATGPLTLGGGRAPAFPENFSNIGPARESTRPIPFGGGGTATMGLGGASVAYPPNLSLSGGAYAPREMGASEFGPARLPQTTSSLTASPLGFDSPLSFSDARSQFNWSPVDAAVAGLLPAGTQPQATSMPIEGGPVSMNINQPQTAEQQGRTAMQTPRGTIWATEQQAINMQTPRTAEQSGSRTPAQQQALLAQIRQNAAERAPQREEREAERQKVLRDRHYEHNIRIAERRAQEALTPSFGGQVGREATMRGAQAMLEAERFKQAQAGRDPMSREPMSAFGMEFRRGSMGEYQPIRQFGSPTQPWQSMVAAGGAQPAQEIEPSPFRSTPTTPLAGGMTQQPSLYEAAESSVSGRPPMSGALASTPFGRREEDPFEKLRTAIGQPRRRRGPRPFGMRLA